MEVNVLRRKEHAMLQNWISGASDRGPKAQFSYADRGDVWASHAVPAAQAHGRNDFGTIAEGIVAQTLVASELGWVRADRLQVGDRVMTFDNGLQPLRGVRHSTLWTAESCAPSAVWPLLVPMGALGNQQDLLLMPEQAVLLESDAADEMFGDPFTLVVAGALAGWRGITRVPPAREVRVVQLDFATEEIIYAQGTTLIHCPGGAAQVVPTAEAMIDLGQPGYARLPRQQSDMLIQRLCAN